MALSEAATAALISGGVSALGAGASAVAAGNLNKKNREFQQQEAEKQRLWNESMAEKQNAWNYEMWQKMSDYDAPENSVQRLRDAGLNPLYYGLDGNTAAAAQPAAQPLGYERATAGNWSNPVAAGLDAAAQIAHISNIQANTAKQKEETLTEVQRREHLQADIVLAKQELNNMLAQEGLSKAQTDEINKRIGWLDRLNEATIAEKEANAALSNAQKKRVDELLEGEKLIQSKTVQDFDEKWNRIRAEIKKLSAETGVLALDFENYALNHASNGFMGSGVSAQNIIRFFSSLDGDRGKNTDEGKEIRQREGDAFGLIYDNK